MATPSPDEPLVLLSGANCSSALWSRVATGPALTPRLTEPTLTGQVDRLLDELPSRFALAGLSLGGIVAMALARVAPNRVSQLGLLSTNPYPPTPAQRCEWSRLRSAIAAGTSARDIQQELLPVLLSAEARATRPDLVKLTLDMAEQGGAAALDAQLRLQATRIDERPGLRRLRCPTILVAAAEDRLCPPARHGEMHALIPHSELIVFKRCGHLSPLERPEEVTTALTGWLSR